METVQQAVNAALSLWSIRVQFGIVMVLVALFFAAWFWVRRRVLYSWALAWLMDGIALGSVLVIATVTEPESRTLTWLLYGLYSVAKMMFAGLLVVGLYRFRRHPWAMRSRAPGYLLLAVMAVTGLSVTLSSQVVQVQTTTYLVIGALLAAGGLSAVVSAHDRGARIAGLVFLIHGTLFLHHFVVLVPTYTGQLAPAYMSRISFLDAISEFLVGLGCVMALGLRAIDEMVAANRKLESSERTLRNLVDADPLTGLYNRRRLRRFMGSVAGSGALIFIDLDGFKAVNDSWGHAAGDDCLVRVAEVMRQEFRSEDGLFRLGGDEFLVVAPGLSETEAHHRVTAMRALLDRPDERGIPLSISVGVAVFDADTSVEEALGQADAAMYRDKGRRKHHIHA